MGRLYHIDPFLAPRTQVRLHKLLQDDKGLVVLLAAGGPPDTPRGSDPARAALAAVEAVAAAAVAGVPVSAGAATGSAFAGLSESSDPPPPHHHPPSRHSETHFNAHI
jgi:hypothetical protein